MCAIQYPTIYRIYISLLSIRHTAFSWFFWFLFSSFYFQYFGFPSSSFLVLDFLFSYCFFVCVCVCVVLPFFSITYTTFKEGNRFSPISQCDIYIYFVCKHVVCFFFAFFCFFFFCVVRVKEKERRGRRSWGGGQVVICLWEGLVAMGGGKLTVNLFKVETTSWSCD